MACRRTDPDRADDAVLHNGASARWDVHHNPPAGSLSHSRWRVKIALGTRYQTVLNGGLRLPVKAFTVSMTAIGRQPTSRQG